MLQLREFTDVIGAIDAGYLQISEAREGKTLGLAQICAACHQSLFAAAAAILRGNPHDSGAPSRRAIEGARTALAIMLDPENAKRWLSMEKRLSKWSARKNGKKPQSLQLRYEVLSNDSMANMLAKFGGMLSDASLHYTPELAGNLQFQLHDDGGKLYSEYLETRESEIANHLGFLAAMYP